MIAVRPGSDAWRVLQAIVVEPGALDAEALGLVLEPPIPLVLPGPEAGHAARSRAYAAWAEAELGPVVGKHRRGGRRDRATERASRLLSELQKRGFVETRGPPVLASWWSDTAKRRGELVALQFAHPGWPREVQGLGAHLVMTRQVEKGPPSVEALLGRQPSGARKQVYRELCAWGVVVPPSRRWPTEAGIRHIEEGGRDARHDGDDGPGARRRGGCPEQAENDGARFSRACGPLEAPTHASWTDGPARPPLSASRLSGGARAALQPEDARAAQLPHGSGDGLSGEEGCATSSRPALDRTATPVDAASTTPSTPAGTAPCRSDRVRASGAWTASGPRTSPGATSRGSRATTERAL